LWYNKNYMKLKLNNINYNIFNNKPVFTVNQVKTISQNINGIHIKNLFIYDKKKA